MISLIFSREGKELISHQINKETTTVGRSQNNSVQLVDSTVSRTHCRIENKDGELILIDSSRNGTLVNGSPISTAELREGDVISIGPWTARLTYQGGRNEMTVVDQNTPTRVLSYNADTKFITEEKVHIIAVSPDQRPIKKRLSQTEITFGSHATSDISIADKYVSRQHCKLILNEGTMLLCDLGSTNGTFVDGVRVDKTRLPNHGAFTIGKTRIRYNRERTSEKVNPSSESALGSMLGKSQVMREVFSLIKRTAPSSVTVCINGESGTGKELAARELHRLSPRGENPFVALNCGAIPSNIIESMLFGHERGAFTGAVERQPGVFEQAHGGTLFLDEIGEMDLDLQTRLLRVLDGNAVRRLGGHDDIRVDVRLVVATNQDLKKLVQQGKFRDDLFYRIYVVPIHLPPLRERSDDIPMLVEYFMEEHSPVDREITITDEAVEKLINHHWPGNVRELKNTLLRAMVTTQKDYVGPRDIQFISATLADAGDNGLNNRERDAIVDALQKAKGNQTRAARMLGIARTTISAKIGRYGIDLKNF